MIHRLDDSLFKIEEEDSLNCSKNEFEYKFTLVPSLDN